MKQILLDKLKNNEVFSVMIKWENSLYFTGYYYDEDGNDYLFNDLKSILCFKAFDELVSYCANNNFALDNNIAEYDFDVMPTNPIDYRDVLNKWNILDTISSNLNTVFEGNENKYNEVYNYLFSCNFAVNPLPKLYKISNDYFQLINNVFDKKAEILEKIHYFNDIKNSF